MQRLSKAAKKVAGLKQTIKAVENGSARLVFLARNADQKTRLPIEELCQSKGILVVEVDSMNDLGKASGIQIGTAAAAILRHGDTPAEADVVQ